MCGRFSQHYTWQEIHDFYSLLRPTTPPNMPPRYNITRFQTIDTVRPLHGGNELVQMLWEFIPSWWSKPLKEKKFSTFNAKGEEIQEKRTFAPAWKRGQRCVIPVSGFYEWPRPKQKGQSPYYIHAADGPIISLAGLWEDWTDRETGEIITSCTIITTTPNDLMKSIPHHRCPVVIAHADLERWMTATPNDAHSLLKPPPDEALSAYRVSSYVNSIANQGEVCIKPETA